MATLYLFRHAKSDWSDPSLSDHDRPLAPRGERAAPAMAEYMEAEGLEPRIVLCSTSARTRRTWELLRSRVGQEAAVVYEEELYGASPAGILSVVSRVRDGAGPVMVVGHNPGLHSTAVVLAGSGPEKARARMRDKFPTGALAVLEAPAQAWDELRPGSCRLERFVRPKDLPDADARGL
ncbi:MAG: histidine phosphatase family protein [Gemmatimonadota bacterium]|jgi:phosphohistidine phosphatase